MNILHYKLAIAQPTTPVPDFDVWGSQPELVGSTELRVNDETIRFLNHEWGTVNLTSATTTNVPSIEWYPLNRGGNADIVESLQQMTVGVLEGILSNVAPQGTNTVVIKPERQARFNNMVATMASLAGMAESAIPGIRELTPAERKDLKLFYKKSYKRF